MTSNSVEAIQTSGSSRVQIGDTNNYYHEAAPDPWLAERRLPDPRDDKARIKDTKGGLLRESYSWILEHDDFWRWRHEENIRLLWIQGDPGKGKTMLLCGITDELEQIRPNGSQLSYFFCQATNSKSNTAAAVLRGLASMLLQQKSKLLKHVKEEYQRTRTSPFDEGENAWYTISRVFKNMLEDPDLSNVYFAIDALDECEKDLPQLLDFISKQTTPRVKWLLSSRHNPDIERKLRITESRTRLSLELKQNAEQVSQAVDIYIQCRLAELEEIEKDEDLLQKLRHTLLSKANGTFLWVALAIQELQDVNSWDMEDVLADMPPGLEELYDRMMQQLKGLKRQDPQYCRSVLATTTTAYRPLHLAELRGLSGLPLRVSDITKIIKMCGSFLTIRDGIVFVVHQSAQDYLLGQSYIFQNGLAHKHYNMFSQSLEKLKACLKEDIYQLQHPGAHIDHTTTPDPDPLAGIRYSSVYWADHLLECRDTKAAKEVLKDNGPIDTFLREKYLNWLEALSLLKAISQGVSAMLGIQNFVTVCSL